MYPLDVFALFPPFPREPKVFVAMSFDSIFKARWERVIIPAVGKLVRNGVRLSAHRVDTRRVADSIQMEIVMGIANCTSFFADVSTIGYLPAESQGPLPRPVRNENVAYEVGLAQAVRLPEEVILFRSDKDSLGFDFANIRVNEYDPDGDPAGAIELMTAAIVSGLKEVELRRHASVRKAVDSLDAEEFMLLGEIAGRTKIGHPAAKTVGQSLGTAQRIRAINGLLESGAISLSVQKLTRESLHSEKEFESLFEYECTEFGREVAFESSLRLGIDNPEFRAELESRYQAELKREGGASGSRGG